MYVKCKVENLSCVTTTFHINDVNSNVNRNVKSSSLLRHGPPVGSAEELVSACLTL